MIPLLSNCYYCENAGLIVPATTEVITEESIFGNETTPCCDNCAAEVHAVRRKARLEGVAGVCENCGTLTQVFPFKDPEEGSVALARDICKPCISDINHHFCQEGE